MIIKDAKAMIPSEISKMLKDENPLFNAYYSLIEHIMEPGVVSVDLSDFMEGTKHATRIKLILQQTEFTSEACLIKTLKILPKHHNLKSIWVDISLNSETQDKIIEYVDTISKCINTNIATKTEIVFIDTLSVKNQICMLGFY